jgi:hypothetical protein
VVPISDRDAHPNPDGHSHHPHVLSTATVSRRVSFQQSSTPSVFILCVKWHQTILHHNSDFLSELKCVSNPTPTFHSGLRFSARVEPHIGHLYTLVAADIFARYNRLVNPNRPVEFVTGTDEHGLKIQRAAHGASRDPQEFCDLLSAEFRVRPLMQTLANAAYHRSGRN